MPGSNSSVRDAAAPEPLSFTVHSMPAPDLVQAQRRQASGRLKLLLLLLACAAPVIASYFTYYVIRPEGRVNYSTLIQPTRALPALALTALDGQAVPAAALKGQWLLVVVGDAACAEACEKRLFMQRQLREMVGRERERITGPGTPAAELQTLFNPAAAPLQMLRAERDAVAAWLQPAPGQALEDHLYIVDPLGEWMMRAPADADPAKVKRDVDRLLRASSSWDKPGR
jgi:hypothetical protein